MAIGGVQVQQPPQLASGSLAFHPLSNGDLHSAIAAVQEQAGKNATHLKILRRNKLGT